MILTNSALNNKKTNEEKRSPPTSFIIASKRFLHNRGTYMLHIAIWKMLIAIQAMCKELGIARIGTAQLP